MGRITAFLLGFLVGFTPVIIGIILWIQWIRGVRVTWFDNWPLFDRLNGAIIRLLEMLENV